MLCFDVSLPFAIGADSFEHIVGGQDREAGGEMYRWDGECGKAENTAATLAVEVDVQVFGVVLFRQFPGVVSVAGLVAGYAPAVLQGMNQTVGGELRQHSRDAGLFQSLQSLLQVGEAQGAVGVKEGAHHQYSVGGGAHTVCFEYVGNLFRIHTAKLGIFGEMQSASGVFDTRLHLLSLNFVSENKSKDYI